VFTHHVLISISLKKSPTYAHGNYTIATILATAFHLIQQSGNTACTCHKRAAWKFTNKVSIRFMIVIQFKLVEC